jgi:hypothetical protein
VGPIVVLGVSTANVLLVFLGEDLLFAQGSTAQLGAGVVVP